METFPYRCISVMKERRAMGIDLVELPKRSNHGSGCLQPLGGWILDEYPQVEVVGEQCAEGYGTGAVDYMEVCGVAWRAGEKSAERSGAGTAGV
jgi:hypothetical protein